MQNLYPLIFGLLASLIGFLAPTMLSMTAVRTTVENGRRAGFQFAAGAASVIFIQGLIAVFFAKYLVANPEIIVNLKKSAIFILVGLSLFFYLAAKKKFIAKGKKKTGNKYFTGFFMSSLNQLAIPFYLTMATLAETNGWLVYDNIMPVIFIVGAVIGAFAIFSVYVVFAEVVSIKYEFIARNINYILSIFFFFLALITLIQLVVAMS